MSRALKQRIRTRAAEAARWVAPPLLERAGRRFGYSVARGGPSGAVPELPPDDDPSWERRSNLVGVGLDLDAQMTFISEDLVPYVKEFNDEVRGRGFELWNGMFQAGDAEILYSLVRSQKPRRILEIGSGNSTLVSAAASIRNSREGSEISLTAVDPDPRVDLSQEIEGLDDHKRIDCTELSLARFDELQAGDFLFIDTTHVVKRGSEVNWLFLEVIPRLAPGVWVHLHDIFLPYDYPPYMFWLGHPNEQYLVQAFLINSDWTIELGLASLFRDRRDRLIELIPSLNEGVPGKKGLKTWPPSSMWIRRGGSLEANGVSR